MKRITYVSLAGASAIAIATSFGVTGVLDTSPALAAQGGGTGAASQGPRVDRGGGGAGGKAGEVARGKRGSDIEHLGEEEEDSDRPEWAGVSGREGKPGQPNPEPGTMKGDEYGDLYVILRNPDGTPVLDENGNVILIGSDGSLIYKTAEGDIPEDQLDLVQEVEFSRLSVGRSADRVLEARLDEAIANLNSSDATVVLDSSGRLSYVVDGEVKTIDSPLENLGLYIELMNTGTIDGLDASVLSSDLAFLVDDQLTTADVAYGAILLAAAADKTSTITVDAVVYQDTILDVVGTDPIVVNGDQYYDFTSVTYDRSDTWGDVIADVLVYDPATDTWKATEVSLYDAVFDGTDASASNIAGFTLAADDALQVIEFIHEYTVPVLPTAVN